MTRTVILCCCIFALSSCAVSAATHSSSRAAPGSPSSVASRGPTAVDVPRTVVTPDGATSLPELFERATKAGQSHETEYAARAFDRVFELEPDGALAPQALFEAGEMYDLAADHAQALARYEQVARRFPAHELAREASLRALRLLTYLESWERAGTLAALTVDRYPDLNRLDQIVVLAALALARVESGDDERASYFIAKGRDVVEQNGLDSAGRLPPELAGLYFALGEVRRTRAERIKFVPVPKDFGATLEQRCQLLLDAQSAYSDAMRAYDAHWSAMAGYRVGELYQKLHEELMQVPPPKAADTEGRRQLFEGAMRLRYSTLLQSAKAMMQHTLSLAERTGERSTWVERAEQARDALDRAILAEHTALDRLPYTRAELQSALDSLSRGRAP